MTDLYPRSRQNIDYSRTEAHYYNAIHPEIFNLVEQKRLSYQMHKLVAEIAPSLPVLDLGSGTGNIAEKIQRRGVQVIACDVSMDMLKENKAKHKVICDVQHLPFRDEVFGAITSYSLLHHLSDLGKMIKEVARVSSCSAILYFDHEPFGTSRKLGHHPYTLIDLINWLIWLILHPSYLKRLAAYLLKGRKHHMQNLKNLNNVEQDKLNVSEFLVMLRSEGYHVQLIQYHSSCCVKAYRR